MDMDTFGLLFLEQRGDGNYLRGPAISHVYVKTSTGHEYSGINADLRRRRYSRRAGRDRGARARVSTELCACPGVRP